MKASRNKIFVFLSVLLLGHSIELPAHNGFQDVDVEHQGSGINSFGDVVNIYNQVRRSSRDYYQSSEYRIYQRELQEQEDLANQICAHCPSVKELTGNVNDILQHMAEEKQNTHPFLRELVGELEGMYYVTMDRTWTPGEDPEVRCRRFELDNHVWPERNDFDEDMALLIFESDVNIESVSMAQIHHQQDRVYFMRGKGRDKDKVIRVDINRDGESRISYYRMIPEQEQDLMLRQGLIQRSHDSDGGELSINYSPYTRPLGHDKNNFVLEQQEENEDDDTNALKDNEWGFMNRISTSSDVSSSEAQIGFAIEHRSKIPRKLRILNFKSSRNLSENVQFQTGVTIDSRDQEASFSLTDSEDSTYIELNVSEGESPEIRVPYQMRLGESQLQLRGDVRARRREAQLNMGLVTTQTEFARIQIREQAGDLTYTVSHDRELQGGRAGTLSVKLQREAKSSGLGRDRDSIWVRYSLAF